VKGHLLSLVAELPREARRNLAREYLQVYLLRLLHEAHAHAGLVFQGGTALRLLHRLPRYSEDLDFSTEGSPLDLESVFAGVGRGLAAAGYRVATRVRTERNVKHALYRFESLPRDIGWSTDPRVALSIKLEVDTAPPTGATIETSLVQRWFPVALRHHDLPSLLAGKVHALLARPYAKGRDWYDLVWYLTEHRDLEPNLLLLGNALRQTGHDATLARDWRHAVRKRLGTLDWKVVAEDVAPFLERSSDLAQLDPALVRKLL
jgi:predicted nucleotidyltransferase component of viral defense system